MVDFKFSAHQQALRTANRLMSQAVSSAMRVQAMQICWETSQTFGDEDDDNEMNEGEAGS